MRNNLQRRGAVYYFRRVVPRDVRHLFLTSSGNPRDEWVWSLRTSDYAEAKTCAAEHYQKTSLLIESARSEPAATAIRSWRREPSEGAVDIESEMMRSSIESAEFFERLESEEQWRAESDPAFAQSIALRREQAAETARLRKAREHRELLEAERYHRKLSLLDLFESYASVVDRHPKTIAQWRPYIVRLVEFIGHDNAHALTDRQIIAWRNHLRDNAEYRGKRLSAKTINGSYLAAVSTLLAWAKGDGLIDRNPMIGIGKVKGAPQTKLRSKEFTADEARTILTATVQPETGRAKKEWCNAKRWCAWLMAYSGARVNEVTQLRKKDIDTIDGVAIMRLTPEAGPIKTKEARVVPLHSHLLDQGFLAFVAGADEGPLFYDPTKRRSDNAINRQSNRLGTKLGEWVRSLGISGVKPNHAWRHLFNTLAVEHGLDHRATLAILGHSSGNVNQSYGSVPVSRLAQEIEKLPRFDIVGLEPR